jgi:hypothetical protein
LNFLGKRTLTHFADFLPKPKKPNVSLKLKGYLWINVLSPGVISQQPGSHKGDYPLVNKHQRRNKEVLLKYPPPPQPLVAPWLNVHWVPDTLKKC